MASPALNNVTNSGNNTASTSWAVNFPAWSSGDLVGVALAWDDSTNVTSVTNPTITGATWVDALPIFTDTGTTVRGVLRYFVATAAGSAGTRTFTPSASEQWTASVFRVPAGDFDSTTPIGAVGTRTQGDGTSVSTPAFSAGASDYGGLIVGWLIADDDPIGSAPTGWTNAANVDRGAVAAALVTRNSYASNSESIAAASWTIASDTWTANAFILRQAPVSDAVDLWAQVFKSDGTTALTNRVNVAESGNITTSYGTFELAFSITGTPTKADWDGALLKLEWTITTANVARSVRVTALELAGGYEVGVTVYSGAAALDGAGSLVATGTAVALGTLGLVGAGDLVGAGTTKSLGASALVGAGDLAGAGVARVLGAAALDGSGLLGATGAARALGTAPLTGTGDLAGDARAVSRGDAALLGASDLAGTGWSAAFATAPLSGAGDVAGTGRATALAVVNFDGAGDLAAAAGSTVEVFLAGAGDIAATGRTTALGATAANGVGDLAGAGRSTAFGSGAVSGAGDLAATWAVTAFGAVSFSGASDIVATPALPTSAQVSWLELETPDGFPYGTLDGSGLLGATAVTTALGLAAFGGAGNLAAETVATVSFGAVSFSGAGNLAGTRMADPPPPTLPPYFVAVHVRDASGPQQDWLRIAVFVPGAPLAIWMVPASAVSAAPQETWMVPIVGPPASPQETWMVPVDVPPAPPPSWDEEL